MILIALILTVAGHAIEDGGSQRKSKVLSQIGTLIFGVGLYLLLGWQLTGLYTLFRISLFDPVRNKAAGQELTYVGLTKWWDQAIRKLRIHPLMLLWVRFIILILAVSLTLQYYV